MTSDRDLERRLTEEMKDRARQLAELRRRRDEEAPFVPGETWVRYAGRVYGGEELTNLVDAAAEFWLTAGRWHDELERGLAAWYGVRSARLVNSGSSANLLALAALTSPTLGARRLRPGDEVITVAAGFPTTVAPIVQLGAVPVFVDVDLATANVEVAQLEEARSERTRAVVLAHTLGNPFDVAAVKTFCERHGLWLVEDACDAAGSLYDGRKVGTFGDVATLSFYPPHHMTTGEGGAVLTSDARLGRIVDSLRDWGRDCWCPTGKDDTCQRRFGRKFGELPLGYDHKFVYGHLGFNLKMTDLQAAVGVAQLGRLDRFVAARRANWRWYRAALADLADVFVLPEPTPRSDPSWFGFMLTVRDGAPVAREAIVRRLEERRVQTRMLFAGNLVRQPALTELARAALEEGRPAPYRAPVPLVATDRLMNGAFWVGVYPGLTPPMRDHVVATLREAVGR